MKNSWFSSRLLVISCSFFLAGLLATPYALVEYYILKSKVNCSINACSEDSLKYIHGAEIISRVVYSKNSDKMIEIIYLKSELLLQLYRRVPSVRIHAASMMYQLASINSKENKLPVHVLQAMRAANSVGEHGLVRIFYEEVKEAGFSFDDMIGMRVQVEDSFAAVMELTPYIKEMASKNGSVVANKLKKDVELLVGAHKNSVMAACQVRDVECSFLLARLGMQECFIDSELGLSPYKSCMSRLLKTIEGQGVYLGQSNMTAACASKERMSECSALAQMLEPYYGTFFGQYFY